MSATWGLHNNRIDAATLVQEGFISIGWDAMGDLREVGDDQERMKLALAERHPTRKSGSVPVAAGVLRRFAFLAQEGDYVIAPNKQDRTINIGRIAGPYEFHPDADTHSHRRRVDWLRTGIPRSDFTQSALNEIGSAVTMFRVSRHTQEFLAAVGHEAAARPVPPVTETEPEVDEVEDEPNAAKVEQYTQDFVLKLLHTDLSHEEFEHFTADLLRAMGYRARVTQFVADGGVDVLVHKDQLGLEPGLIKVQCKHTTKSHGNADVNQLAGTLGHGEVGLFVTLGSFSAAALAIERQRSDIRLMSGSELVELTLEHYGKLPNTWRSRIPLRRIYVVDRGQEGY